MKAIVLKGFGSVDNFELQEVETPQAAPGQVLVRIRAAGFNPVDYQIRQGLPESKLLKSPILGREFAGIVTAIGEGVKGFHPGDEVFAYSSSVGSNGTYAEYISVPQEILAFKPTHPGFEEAAGIPLVGLTAWQTFERIKAGAGDTIFVAGGAGGVGTILLKLLKAHTHHCIITTAGNETSRAHLLQLGLSPEQIIDYKIPDLSTSLIAANDGKLFDIAIDLVGGSMSETCSAVLKTNGILADVAFLGTEAAREQLFDKGAVVINISNYAYSLTRQPAVLQYYGQRLQLLTDMINAGTITAAPVFITGGLATDSVKKAHTLLEDNQSKGRKFVMTIEEYP